MKEWIYLFSKLLIQNISWKYLSYKQNHSNVNFTTSRTSSNIQDWITLTTVGDRSFLLGVWLCKRKPWFPFLGNRMSAWNHLYCFGLRNISFFHHIILENNIFWRQIQTSVKAMFYICHFLLFPGFFSASRLERWDDTQDNPQLGKSGLKTKPLLSYRGP